MRGNKWSAQILELTKAYSLEATKPNVSGLSVFLQVSRQCIYDWSVTHDDFRVVLNNMKHGAIDDAYEEIPLPRPSRSTKKKNPLVKKVASLPPEAEAPVFVDELGDDEEWEFDD